MQDFNAFTQDQLCIFLLGNLAKLDRKDRDFAHSLAVKCKITRFPASEKQFYWLRELCRRASGEQQQPERKTTDIGSLAGINGLFAKRAEGDYKSALRSAIVLDDGERTIRLSLAGETSRHPGTINVTTNGSFENRTWFGRILENGKFEASPRAETPDSVIGLLRRFAADPVAVASEHGRKTGACCFCNRPLQDKRSTEVGYGPICAERFGLSWGAVEQAA
jgi:Family of unknown function (DUF6011)